MLLFKIVKCKCESNRNISSFSDSVAQKSFYLIIQKNTSFVVPDERIERSKFLPVAMIRDGTCIFLQFRGKVLECIRKFKNNRKKIVSSFWSHRVDGQTNVHDPREVGELKIAFVTVSWHFYRENTLKKGETLSNSEICYDLKLSNLCNNKNMKSKATHHLSRILTEFTDSSVTHISRLDCI